MTSASTLLNVCYLGGAFIAGDLMSTIIRYWRFADAHHPLIAYHVTFGIKLVLQIAA